MLAGAGASLSPRAPPRERMNLTTAAICESLRAPTQNGIGSRPHLITLESSSSVTVRCHVGSLKLGWCSIKPCPSAAWHSTQLSANIFAPSISDACRLTLLPLAKDGRNATAAKVKPIPQMIDLIIRAETASRVTSFSYRINLNSASFPRQPDSLAGFGHSHTKYLSLQQIGRLVRAFSLYCFDLQKKSYEPGLSNLE